MVLDVIWTGFKASSLLYHAVQCGSLDIAKYLVELGADVIWKDNHYDRSLLFYAVEYCSLDIAK